VSWRRAEAWLWLGASLWGWIALGVLVLIALVCVFNFRTIWLRIDTRFGRVSYPLHDDRDSCEGFALTLKGLLYERQQRAPLTGPAPIGGGGRAS
jgi:hypothetical protein